MKALQVLALVFLMSLIATEASAAGPALRRFALIAASNDGGKDRERLRFANSDATAMATVLRDLGGVRAEDLQLLPAVRRAGLERAFQQIRASVAAARKNSRRSELFVYYSGHSDDQGLLLGGERVSYRELRRWIDEAGADVRIVVLDSCASGAIIRTRGGTRRPSFLSDVSVDARGHAFLTASAADEAAQESDRIGAGFFSHYLLSGLRGAADANRDKLVTLAEAYQFSYHETLRGTGSAAQSQHPAYDFQLAGQGDLVLTDLRASGASLILSDGIVGRVLVRSKSGQLVAELRKGQGYPVQLGLGPGSYDVSLERDGGLSTASVTLLANNATALGPGAFRVRAAERAAARGPVDPSPEQASFRDELMGEDSLVGRTREFGGYASVAFRYTRLGGEDALLVSPELALLLNRRVTLGFTGGGGASGPKDELGTRMMLGYLGVVFRYQFLFDGPFSFSAGAVAGAGAVEVQSEHEASEDTPSDDSLFLFEPQLEGHVSVSRFLRFGVDAGYRIVAAVERYPVTDVRGATAGFHVQLGWF